MIVKLWTVVNNVIELQGECQIIMDQLNMGEGTREEYDMLKDAEVVGKITIESKFFRPPKIDIPEGGAEA